MVNLTTYNNSKVFEEMISHLPQDVKNHIYQKNKIPLTEQEIELLNKVEIESWIKDPDLSQEFQNLL